MDVHFFVIFLFFLSYVLVTYLERSLDYGDYQGTGKGEPIYGT